MTDVDAALVEALQRKLNHLQERVGDLEADRDELRRENEHLKDRVADLESRTDLEMISYDEMSKRQKVERLKQYALEQARSTNGKHAMDYNAVMTLFNGEPARSYTFDLMEMAGAAEGYNYDKRERGNNRLTVDAARANNSAVNSPAKTNEASTPAN